MQLLVDKFSLSYKIRTPLPFAENEFFKGIEKEFIRKTVDLVSILPDGTAYPTREQYESDSIVLVYLPPLGIVGVSGNVAEEVLKKYTFISKVLTEKMNIKDDVLFVELHAQGRARGKLIPLTCLSKFQNKPSLDIINETFKGITITPMCIRVCSENGQKEKIPFREVFNWFEFRIEVLIQNPAFYGWDLIYRDIDITKVQDFSHNIPDKISKIIEDFEK